MDKQERAKLGASERWNPTVPKASHSGILKFHALNIEIPCAIVKNDKGEVLRLLTQKGMIKALGRSDGKLDKSSGGTFPAFITANNLKPFITKDIIEGGESVEFRMENGKKAIGYRCEFLPQICQVYLQAERANVLTPQQKRLAQICSILQNSFSIVGMISLIDEATGYQKIRESFELQQFLERYLNKELAAWAKRFPDEFYKEIYRLRNWAWHSISQNRYSVVGKYTRDLVYERLAPGILEEMERLIPRDANGNKRACYHQLLNDEIGLPKLKEHFSALIAIMKLSKNWNELISNVNLVLPKTIEFNKYIKVD